MVHVHTHWAASGHPAERLASAIRQAQVFDFGHAIDDGSVDDEALSNRDLPVHAQTFNARLRSDIQGKATEGHALPKLESLGGVVIPRPPKRGTGKGRACHQILQWSSRL